MLSDDAVAVREAFCVSWNVPVAVITPEGSVSVIRVAPLTTESAPVPVNVERCFVPVVMVSVDPVAILAASNVDGPAENGSTLPPAKTEVLPVIDMDAPGVIAIAAP